ncbi:MAG: hypothetical protein N2438_12430 [Limisphaera sp.]|nr:hypothetical protein [Limisphaera sp.]
MSHPKAHLSDVYDLWAPEKNLVCGLKRRIWLASADDVGGSESADGKAAVRQVGNLRYGGGGIAAVQCMRDRQRRSVLSGLRNRAER